MAPTGRVGGRGARGLQRKGRGWRVKRRSRGEAEQKGDFGKLHRARWGGVPPGGVLGCSSLTTHPAGRAGCRFRREETPDEMGFPVRGQTQRAKHGFMLQQEDGPLCLEKAEGCTTGPLHTPCRPWGRASLSSDPWRDARGSSRTRAGGLAGAGLEAILAHLPVVREGGPCPVRGSHPLSCPGAPGPPPSPSEEYRPQLYSRLGVFQDWLCRDSNRGS